MPKKPPQKKDVSGPIRRAGTVALVGRSNVGKSTLMNRLLGEALAITSPIAQTTRDRILGVIRHGEAQIALLDTPGLHRPVSALGKRMNQTARAAVDEADVVCFVCDPDVKSSLELKVRQGDRTLLADIGEGKPTILIVNKIDLVKPRERLFPFLQAMSELRDFAAVIPMAGQSGDGADRLLDEVAKILPERDAMFEEDEMTDAPLRFFVAEFVRGEVLRMARAELPYATAVTVDAFDDTKRVPRITCTIHVERDGQKPILIGKGGSTLKAIGIASRERVERLMGKQVHLELFVRVTEGWSNDPKLLNDLGYGDSGGST